MNNIPQRNRSRFLHCQPEGRCGQDDDRHQPAAGLATHKQRVLLVDLDPQGNATMGSGIDKNSLASNLYQVLIGEATIAQARVRSESGGYDVLPANRELSGAEIDRCRWTSASVSSRPPSIPSSTSTTSC